MKNNRLFSTFPHVVCKACEKKIKRGEFYVLDSDGTPFHVHCYAEELKQREPEYVPMLTKAIKEIEAMESPYRLGSPSFLGWSQCRASCLSILHTMKKDS